MQDDSLETLLLRHYGPLAEAPTNLEQRLSASVRREAALLEKQEAAVRIWHKRRLNRRDAMRLVAAGAAGAGALGFGLECLRVFEAGLLGQDTQQHAYT